MNIHPKIIEIITSERICPNCKHVLKNNINTLTCDDCRIIFRSKFLLHSEQVTLMLIGEWPMETTIDFKYNKTDHYFYEQKHRCLNISNIPKKFDIESINQFINFYKTFQ